MTPAPKRPEWVWSPNDEKDDDTTDAPDTDSTEDADGDEDGGAS